MSSVNGCVDMRSTTVEGSSAADGSNSRATAAEKERTVREEGGRASATEKAVAFKTQEVAHES